MSEVLNVVIVGCGRIAGGFDADGPAGAVLTHAGAYSEHSGFRIAACVDPDPDRRAEFRRRWNVASDYADLRACLEHEPHLDVASICSPTCEHRRDLDLLAESGVRAVFCEKPVTDSVAASARIVDDYRQAGKLLAVAYLRRWDAAMTELKQRIADGDWGQVRSIAGFYNKGALNNGSHLVDLIHFLIGPTRLDRVVAAHADNMADDPTVDAVLRLADDQPVHLIGGDAHDYAFFELTLVAERGVIQIEDSGFHVRTRWVRPSPRYAGYRDVDDGRRTASALDRAFLAAVDNIAHALQDGAPLASSGETALAALQVCSTMIEEARAL